MKRIRYEVACRHGSIPETGKAYKAYKAYVSRHYSRSTAKKAAATYDQEFPECRPHQLRTVKPNGKSES